MEGNRKDPRTEPGLSAGVEIYRVNATRLAVHYRSHHLCRPVINIFDMDDIRNSFSRLKKDLKHRLKGRKDKPDRKGANAAGERVDSSGSFPRLKHCISASDCDGEGNRISTGGQQVHSRDQFPQPEPVLAGGSDNDGKGRKTDVGGKEASQRYSRLDPNAEFVVDSRPSREAERVHPSPSTPSIPPTGAPDST